MRGESRVHIGAIRSVENKGLGNHFSRADLSSDRGGSLFLEAQVLQHVLGCISALLRARGG